MHHSFKFIFCIVLAMLILIPAAPSASAQKAATPSSAQKGIHDPGEKPVPHYPIGKTRVSRPYHKPYAVSAPTTLNIPGTGEIDVTPEYEWQDGILLRWETASEVDMLGFNVLRSTSESGSREQINTDMIPVLHPGQMLGDSYTYNDADLVWGETYYYWIEILGRDNARESVGAQSARAGYRYYLPDIQ